MDGALDGVAVSKVSMLRLTPFLFLVACAAPKPIVGPAAVESRPAGTAVMADADKRYEAFSTASSAALQAALEEAKARTPMVPGVDEHTPAQGAQGEYKREPSWLPGEHRFRIVYHQTIVMLQEGFMADSGGCGKYRNWPPRGSDSPTPEPAPQSQPSPMPCPPPVPIRVQRSWSATMGLVLEYSEDGKLVAERPSPPAPNLPKPAAPKP